MAKLKALLVHLGVLITLLAAAVAMATWQGALLPFDLRYSVMVTGAGLVLLVLGWGLLWLVPVVLSALMRPLSGRIALAPLGVLGFVLLHRAFGPARGFAPLDTLTWPDAALLYLFPVTLSLVIGSALGMLVRLVRKKTTYIRTQTQAEPASQG
ncbi:hypothetical protein [Aliiroseovarius sediminis]|uniref:hypothetical protein n=1 Tax=Aliiroseovarius sediminis TaxID=2925839 RepID=UPI001F57D76E|nr:hypothetical protein [Aliiroseovarius sediminis]MCI2395956.1 hypothetical protein [Aliiroseovarius sediminis]